MRASLCFFVCWEGTEQRALEAPHLGKKLWFFTCDGKEGLRVSGGGGDGAFEERVKQGRLRATQAVKRGKIISQGQRKKKQVQRGHGKVGNLG